MKFNITNWVSRKIHRRGLEYYRQGRVSSFEFEDENCVCAEVKGSEVYTVTIKWNGIDEPETECTCPYNWEPICKHAVAVMLHWMNDAEEITDENLPVDEPFDRKKHVEEIANIERKKRSSKRSLASLKIQTKPEAGLLGEYSVSSETFDANYSVMVRDAGSPHYTTCTCPDYLINELGTCKHIELINDHVSHKRKRARKNSDVWISIFPKNTHECEPVAYEEIHAHSEDPEIKKILGDGYFKSGNDGKTYKEKFEIAVTAIKKKLNGNGSAVKIAEPVYNTISQLDSETLWSDKVKDSDWEEYKKSLNIKLYDYQEKGILFAVKNRRAFIGDDMGLGKTVQAIAAAGFIKKIRGVKKVVIFSPASLKYQWKKEIEKIANESAEIVSGNRFARSDIYKNSNATFLIVNYELIYRDLELIQKLNPEIVILDEAQRIKNWETKTAKWLKRLRSEFAIILTGTPFENRLLELHSLCEFLRPRALGPMWRLLPTYSDIDEHEKVIGYSNIGQLRSKLSKFFIRRERSVVQSQLPEKISNEYLTEISSEQLECHDEYKSTLVRLLNIMKKRPLTPEEIKRVFMCLTCMRIISNALAQHDWEKYKNILSADNSLSVAQIKSFHSPKLLEFREVMEELLAVPNTKFVIFSQWERMLLLASAVIRDVLMKNNAESVIFSGSLATHKRPEVIERLNNDPKLRVFFSTDAGGVGLNLQASASYVINLEMPWNPAVLEQRIARVHRLGQKQTVNVINFISTGCIEERVYDAVCNKKVLFDGVFDGSTDNIKFEKGASFIDKLKGMVEEDCKESAGETEVDKKDKEALPIRSSSDGSNEKQEIVGNGKTLDFSGIMRALGVLGNKPELSAVSNGQFKLKIHEEDGEIKLSMNKPPKELISGIKSVLSGIINMMEKG